MMSRKLPIRWSAYERCPVCFRTYDCRMVRLRRRIIWGMGQMGQARVGPVRNIAVGWEDFTMTRPHTGRHLTKENA